MVSSNENRMGKYEQVRVFAKKLGVSQAIAQHTLECYQEMLLESLHMYDSVKIGDFAILEKVVKKEQRRILNGKEVITPEHTILKARVTKTYKKY